MSCVYDEGCKWYGIELDWTSSYADDIPQILRIIFLSPYRSPEQFCQFPTLFPAKGISRFVTFPSPMYFAWFCLIVFDFVRQYRWLWRSYATIWACVHQKYYDSSWICSSTTTIRKTDCQIVGIGPL